MLNWLGGPGPLHMLVCLPGVASKLSMAKIILIQVSTQSYLHRGVFSDSLN